VSSCLVSWVLFSGHFFELECFQGATLLHLKSHLHRHFVSRLLPVSCSIQSAPCFCLIGTLGRLLADLYTLNRLDSVRLFLVLQLQWRACSLFPSLSDPYKCITFKPCCLEIWNWSLQDAFSGLRIFASAVFKRLSSLQIAASVEGVGVVEKRGRSETPPPETTAGQSCK
jgi:hypothetical protein